MTEELDRASLLTTVHNPSFLTGHSRGLGLNTVCRLITCHSLVPKTDNQMITIEAKSWAKSCHPIQYTGKEWN